MQITGRRYLRSVLCHRAATRLGREKDRFRCQTNALHLKDYSRLIAVDRWVR